MTPVWVATKLLLVVHRYELRKPTNTGHLAVACLQDTRVCLRGRQAVPDDAVTWDPQTTPLFLFPCPDAKSLDEWKATQGDSPRSVTLIVPDGTWRQAKRVRQRVEGLAEIQAVRLPSSTSSDYRLRQAYGQNRLATMEAIAHALGILEGPAIGMHLLRVFRTIVDRTLWSNGRLAKEQVTGGIPSGARQDGPLLHRITDDAVDPDTL
jgi:DTW domain-containing protein YfiP